ncbi:hypothetical protein ATCC90586_007489 [Pythium insidiosum]|nr:hypothetical protein ATCC90586_007489 [Pythium insidiosum]
MLPASFTWARLHEEMKLAVEESGVRRFEPAEATFRKLLRKHCPDIRISWPRSNVCDICVIYHSNAVVDFGADRAEEQAKHAQNARAMRYCTLLAYAADAAAANEDHIVLTMDYSQNLTLPNLANTPSQFYFMSLISVSLFGIYDAYSQRHTHFLYSEGGKGSNEVISMVNRYLRNTYDGEGKHLTVYADNCGGQNKNNFVIKYFLLLAHIGYFEKVSYKFFVKGHTKNASDRGFGHIKKRFVKSDCWTMEQVTTIVSEAASSSDAVSLEEEDAPFFDFKPVVNELYKNVKGLQKYQIFEMSHEYPGRLECRESPLAPPIVFYLSRSYDGKEVDEERARELLDQIAPLPLPAVNPEKVYDLHKNVVPYLPVDGFTLENVTVNEAEYEGMLRGLARARELGIRDVVVVGDSRIAAQQCQGTIGCNEARLQVLLNRFTSLRTSFDSLELAHVKREFNSPADFLASKALQGDNVHVSDVEGLQQLRDLNKLQRMRFRVRRVRAVGTTSTSKLRVSRIIGININDQSELAFEFRDASFKPITLAVGLD